MRASVPRTGKAAFAEATASEQAIELHFGRLGRVLETELHGSRREAVLATQNGRDLAAKRAARAFQLARDGGLRLAEQAPDSGERQILSVVQPQSKAIFRLEPVDRGVQRLLRQAAQTLAFGFGRRR